MTKLYCYKCGKTLEHKETFTKDEQGKRWRDVTCRRCGNLKSHSLIEETISGQPITGGSQR